MSELKDKWDIDIFLKDSNLHFVSSGILKVNDPLFLTRWDISETGFVSTTKYTKLKEESFSLPMENNEMPDTWNHFGFIQNIKIDGQMNAPYHRNKHIELHYVEKGTFKLKINQSMVTLNQYDICIINPHCYHSDIVETDDLKLYIIGINEEFIPRHKANIRNLKFVENAFRKGSKISEYIIIRNASNISREIKELEEKINTEEVYQCLRNIVQALPSDKYEYIVEEETSRNTMLFEEMHQFIHRNYASITLEDLEFYFNFSKDHISRIIKEESGLSFSKFTQKVKIDKAKSLLMETDLTIKDIMNQVGYKNETFFYKKFKEETGFLPNEFRINNIVES